MKVIVSICMFVLLSASFIWAEEPNAQNHENQLRAILERKQSAVLEFERGKVLLDHGSAIMRDSQRLFNELATEENRLREKLLEARNKNKPAKN